MARFVELDTTETWINVLGLGVGLGLVRVQIRFKFSSSNMVNSLVDAIF